MSTHVPVSREEAALAITINERLGVDANLLLAAYVALWRERLDIRPAGTRWEDVSQSVLEREKIKVDGHAFPFEGLRFVDFDGALLLYEGDEYWQFQGHEHHSFSLPAEWLWTDWRPLAEKQFADALAAYEQKRADAAAQAEQKEIEQLARLKEKYERNGVS